MSYGPECKAWLDVLRDDYSEDGISLLERACTLAESAHHGQKRASGEPYIAHPLAVAELLHGLNMDHETLAAAILHDVVEDTDVTLDQIDEAFGDAIRTLVDGVTKMDVINEFQSEEWAGHYHRKQVDALRKLLLAMVDDVRVVLIKLADRLHNMRTLHHLGEEKRYRISKETIDIYAPLASRLGVWQFKWEMEDLAFRYLEPEIYRSLVAQLDEQRVRRERYIEKLVLRLRNELAEAGINAKVAGRAKHLYSILV